MGKSVGDAPHDSDRAINHDFIGSLIAKLHSSDMRVRVKARDALVKIGEPALLLLVKALDSRDQWTRVEAAKALEGINGAWGRHASKRTIRAFVIDLSSKDSVVRVVARRSLVRIGKRSVKALTRALRSKNTWSRWEAAKALGEIGGAAATAALVAALEDELFDVRWVAAEALGAIGDHVIVPLLRELVHKPNSVWLREGAHHVFHELKRRQAREALIPVLKALEGGEPDLEVPLAAEKALDFFGRR